MQPYGDELAANGVEYHPFAVSCWGRLHPGALRMLHTLARRIARRNGSTSYAEILRRLQARITTQIMKRAAKMVRVCMPCAPAALEEAVADPPVDNAAYLRAGHPSTCNLCPYISVLPSGTPGGPPSGSLPTGSA